MDTPDRSKSTLVLGIDVDIDVQKIKTDVSPISRALGS